MSSLSDTSIDFSKKTSNDYGTGNLQNIPLRTGYIVLPKDAGSGLNPSILRWIGLQDGAWERAVNARRKYARNVICAGMEAASVATMMELDESLSLGRRMGGSDATTVAQWYSLPKVAIT